MVKPIRCHYSEITPSIGLLLALVRQQPFGAYAGHYERVKAAPDARQSDPSKSYLDTKNVALSVA